MRQCGCGNPIIEEIEFYDCQSFHLGVLGWFCECGEKVQVQHPFEPGADRWDNIADLRVVAGAVQQGHRVPNGLNFHRRRDRSFQSYFGRTKGVPSAPL